MVETVVGDLQATREKDCVVQSKLAAPSAKSEERRATSDGLNDLGLGPELIDEMAQMQRLTHTFGGA
jgi:hypothetical protein